jgi:hypothetical protein
MRRICNDGCGRRPDRIQDLRTRQEHDSRARGSQHPAGIAGIKLEIVPAPFDRAEGDRIDHDPRLEARLDHEQSADFLQHCHR